MFFANNNWAADLLASMSGGLGTFLTGLLYRTGTAMFVSVAVGATMLAILLRVVFSGGSVGGGKDGDGD